jgi:hypothetical protein
MPGTEATTPSDIFEAMYSLCNCHDKQFRVSVVYCARAGDIIRIGDSLNVVGSKPPRWWQKKTSDQLRLPFAMYEPAQVISATYSSSNSMMKVKIALTNEIYGNIDTIMLTHDGNDRGIVRAIKIHTVTRQLVEEEDQTPTPFATTTNGMPTLDTESGPPPNQPDCAANWPELLNRGIQNGLEITPTGVCYDARTGQRLGDNADLQSSEGLGATVAVHLRGLDGISYRFIIARGLIRQIGERELPAMGGQMYGGWTESVNTQRRHLVNWRALDASVSFSWGSVHLDTDAWVSHTSEDSND